MKKTLAVLMTLLILAMLIVSCDADSPVVIHKVTFDADNGSEATIKEVIDGEKVQKPDAPEKTGYTFLGWYDVDTPFDFETSVKQDYSLTARWQIQTFTVSFDANGGKVSYDSQTIDYGAKVDTATVPDPTKAGHTFLGWFDGSDKFDFDTPITGNITLTAQWDYKVIFDPDNGEAPVYVYIESARTIAEGAIADPEKKGFAFKGWYTDPKNEETKFEFGKTQVTADLKLTAKWKKTYACIGNYNQKGIPNDYYEVEEGYMFHFTDKDSNGYDWDIRELVKKYNEENDKSFVFEGWYFRGTLYKPGTKEWEETMIPVTEPITLTAKWQDQTVFHTVTFVDEDGTTELLTPEEVAKGKTVYIPEGWAPYREGYTFVGWYTEAEWSNEDGKTFDFDNTTVTDNIKLKAKWKINTYTVTFDTKGGTTATYTVSVEYNKTVSKPTTDPEKYYGFFEKCGFKGWYNGSKEFDFSTPITEDITLTAKWTYKVILKTAADDDTVDTQYVEEGGTVTKPAENPRKDGCLFDKWTTDRDGKNEYDFESEVNRGLTLYAQFITLKVGGTVQLGTVPWRVLAIAEDGKSALVISLDILEYHSFNIGYFFNYSNISSYINSEGFITKYGLTDVDMCNVEVSSNEDSQKTIVGSGSDKIFLLSGTEAETYFSNTDDRRAWYIYSDYWYGRPSWCLRTGSTWTWMTTRHIEFYTVEEYGRIQKIDFAYNINNNVDMALRPAFWIKLNT